MDSPIKLQAVKMAGYLNFFETAEARGLREEYNFAQTGDRGTSEEPSMIEMPTTAGSVQLDMAAVAGTKAGDGAGAESSKVGGRQAAGSSWGGGKPPRQQQQKSKRKMMRRDEGAAASSDEEAQQTGGASSSKAFSNSTEAGAPMAQFFHHHTEDDVPPLTAEARARATDTGTP